MTRALLLLCLLLTGVMVAKAAQRVTNSETVPLELRLDALEKRVQALEAGR